MNQSERRHRIQGDEVLDAIEGVTLYLEKLCRKKDDLDTATRAFRLRWRLIEDHPGNPGYPSPITWALIESSISYGTIESPQADTGMLHTQDEGRQPTCAEKNIEEPTASVSTPLETCAEPSGSGGASSDSAAPTYASAMNKEGYANLRFLPQRTLRCHGNAETQDEPNQTP